MIIILIEKPGRGSCWVRSLSHVDASRRYIITMTTLSSSITIFGRIAKQSTHKFETIQEQMRKIMNNRFMMVRLSVHLNTQDEKVYSLISNAFD